MRMLLAPAEVTPPLDHEVVQKIARQIKPDAVAVKVKRASRLRPVGNCYWNVASVVQQSGGQAALGWMICWWPQLYAVAIHHAVWRMPDGRLIDVTEPQPADKAAAFTIFAPDESRPVSLDMPPRIDNAFLPLSPAPEVGALLVAYQAKQTVVREIDALHRQLGIGRDHYLAMAAGEKHAASVAVKAGPAARAASQALQARLHAVETGLGRAIQALFDAARRD